MTAEARSITHEVAPYEPLTIGTYNELLTAARGLHFGVKTGERYGDFEVRNHTDQETFMDARGDRSSVLYGAQLVIEDTPSNGILLRTIRTRPFSASANMVQERALLLSSFNEQPKILPLDYLESQQEYPGPLVDRIALEGFPLDENSAKKWTESLHNLHQERRTARVSKIAELTKKFVPKIW